MFAGGTGEQGHGGGGRLVICAPVSTRIMSSSIALDRVCGSVSECVALRCVQVFHAKIDAQTQVANAGIMAEKAKRDHAKMGLKRAVVRK